jgi:hypothetical protein
MTEPGESASSVKAAKPEKRKQTIIVIATIIGVLLTYLIYRRSQSSSGGTASVTVPSADSSMAGASDATDTALSQLSNQLGNLTSLLTPPPADDSAPTAGFDPTDKNVIENITSGQYFQVQSGGLWWLDPSEAAQLGNPAASSVFAADENTARWQPNTTTADLTPIDKNQSVA